MSQEAGEGTAEEELKPAPDFSLPVLQGALSLKDMRGDVVLLSFFSTGCGDCKKELPHLQRFHQAYAKKGLRVVGISLGGDVRRLTEFIKERGITFTILLAGRSQVPRLYQVRPIPDLYIIGRDGNIRHRHIGFAPGMEKTWEKDITELLKEKRKSK